MNDQKFLVPEPVSQITLPVLQSALLMGEDAGVCVCVLGDKKYMKKELSIYPTPASHLQTVPIICSRQLAVRITVHLDVLYV